MGYKIPTIAGKGYTFYLEPYPNKVFVHCDVVENTPSVIKEMLSKWKLFTEAITMDLYALHDDTKNTKAHKHFLKKFGFTYKETLPTTSGTSVELWFRKGI